MAALLNQHGSFQVVANERSPKNLVEAAKARRCQVLVVDSTLLDPREVQFLMGARAFGDFRIVFVIQESEREGFAEFTADGLVSRQNTGKDLFAALGEAGVRVNLRRPMVRESVVREHRSEYGSNTALSSREIDVAHFVGEGLSNRKIAEATGLQEQSVKNLVSVIMKKLGCANRVQVAIKLAERPEVNQGVS
ncbi:MAG: response regulator transcription factor [Fimbriimonas sp.]